MISPNTDTPTLADLEAMAAEYGRLLLIELDCTRAVADLKAAAEETRFSILDAAYAAGAIDACTRDACGKNAEIRASQERACLAGRAPEGLRTDVAEDVVLYAETVEAISAEEYQAGVAAAERKAHEAHISLLKAWLYSQSGKQA